MIKVIFLLLAYLICVNGHALMTDPPQRGILGGSSKFAPDLKIIDGAPRDFSGHFPAGDKSTTPGAGKRSQEVEGNFQWSPYEPLRPGFRFRAGVCGDLKSKPEHLRGGEYYFDGRVTKTYQQGGILEMRQAVVAHHNGYSELYVCDVKKCNGEISEKCFRDGFCYPLERASNPECDGGMSKKCAPIDSNHPTRWYMPCTSQVNDQGWDDYLGRYATFRLPSFLTCEHCVLQWFYTAANNCNPPGVVEYFKGPDGPKNWGNCPGQAGAVGGFTQVQNDCGEGNSDDQFPEEYYQCADISIESSGRSGSSSPPATRAPATRAPATTQAAPRRTPPPGISSKSSGVFEMYNFIADGEVVETFTTSLTIDISSYKKVAIEAVTSRAVRPVEFYLDGDMVWDEGTGPYFLYGNNNRDPNYFNTERLNAVLNRPFELEVRWQDESLKATILMTK